MTIDLSSYTNIASGLFVKIECSYYKATPASSPSTEIFRFSDQLNVWQLGGEDYYGLGKLLSISETVSEIRGSNNEVSISVSGIPNTSIAEIINSRIKGSTVSIYRVIFDVSTHQPLSIDGNPAGRFFGLVNNYSLSEEYDIDARSASNTITFICSGILDVLANTTKGRRTNPQDQKSYYATDVSMDRVPTLVGTYFDFGAPK